MITDKKMDPVLLEKDVKELINAAKIKISNLAEELSILQKDNEDLDQIIQRVQGEKDLSQRRLEEVKAAIEKETERNESLNRLRDEKQDELGRKKADLAELLERTEKEHSDLRSSIRHVAEEEKKAKERRAGESARNQQEQANLKKSISQLSDGIARKEMEIEKLTKELNYLNSKEKDRLAVLEAEKKKLMKFIANT